MIPRGFQGRRPQVERPLALFRHSSGVRFAKPVAAVFRPVRDRGRAYRKFGGRLRPHARRPRWRGMGRAGNELHGVNAVLRPPQARSGKVPAVRSAVPEPFDHGERRKFGTAVLRGNRGRDGRREAIRRKRVQNVFPGRDAPFEQNRLRHGRLRFGDAGRGRGAHKRPGEPFRDLSPRRMSGFVNGTGLRRNRRFRVPRSGFEERGIGGCPEKRPERILRNRRVGAMRLRNGPHFGRNRFLRRKLRSRGRPVLRSRHLRRTGVRQRGRLSRSVSVSPGNVNVGAFGNRGRLQVPLQIGVLLGRGGL